MDKIIKIIKSHNMKQVKKTLDKQDLTNIITNRWKDLSDTAKALDVPVSVVLQAREILKTNRRDAVVEHIKTWTPVKTSSGHPIGIPVPVVDNSIDPVQVKKEKKYNDLKNLYLENLSIYPYQWPIDSKISVLFAAVDAGITIDLKKEGWIVPLEMRAKEEAVRNSVKQAETKLPNILPAIVEITETDISWWEKLLRKPKVFRVAIFNDGHIQPQWYHGGTLLKTHNECTAILKKP